MRPGLLLPVLLLALLILGAGCTGAGTGPAGPSWSVSGDGYLSLSCPAPATIDRQVLEKNSSLTLTRVSFHNIDEEVYGLLAEPAEQAVGAVVLAPGAGVTKEDEKTRVEDYAMAGCAALVLDIRGNGGETPGRGFSPDRDYLAFNAGSWPEFYKTACDISTARWVVDPRRTLGVWAMGASNGGRYAAIAAAADRNFTGFIGVSTSGFGLAGNQYTGNASRFLLSIDPDHAIGKIAPRPVWIFHSRRDPIINFTLGQELFGRAGDPKKFIVFNGTHGENGEVDARVEQICTEA